MFFRFIAHANRGQNITPRAGNVYCEPPWYTVRKMSLKILAVRLSITALFHNEKCFVLMESGNINHDCATREENIYTCALLFGLKFKHFLIIVLRLCQQNYSLGSVRFHDICRTRLHAITRSSIVHH